MQFLFFLIFWNFFLHNRIDELQRHFIFIYISWTQRGYWVFRHRSFSPIVYVKIPSDLIWPIPLHNMVSWSMHTGFSSRMQTSCNVPTKYMAVIEKSLGEMYVRRLGSGAWHDQGHLNPMSRLLQKFLI